MAPVSNLPLVYFVAAHASLASACAALFVWPALPGAFFLHPKMVALVHLLTLGWLSGSILGAFYIVAPLALRMPLPVGRVDWVMAAVFWAGTSGLAWHAWHGEYDGVAWSALSVGTAFVWVAQRVWRGLRTAVVPWPVAVHVALAFLNLVASVLYGGLVAWDRGVGQLPYSPLQMAYAHAHLAAIGWVLMMVVGLSYRLIPMFLPAAMPTGASLVWSAVLIEVGLVGLVLALPVGHAALPLAAGTIVLGLIVFVRQIRGALAHRMPRPPALPARDWSTWQTHTALAWLGVAIVSGMWLTIAAPSSSTIQIMWIYGVTGLVGFLAQIVVGIQGRLVPMYLWYRAWDRRPGPPPAVSANALPSARWARLIFLLWVVGVPTLIWGLSTNAPGVIRVAGGVLMAGVVANAAYLVAMLRRVGTPVARV